MPFRSEAQRRFLWATQKRDKAGNVIAKKWAHEKGAKNKGLPMHTKKKEAKVQLAKSLAKALGKNKKLLTRKNFDSAMFATGALTGVGSLGMMLNNQRKQKQMQKTAARGEVGYQFLKLIGAKKAAKAYKKKAVGFGDALSEVYQTNIPGKAGKGLDKLFNTPIPKTPKSPITLPSPKAMSDELAHNPLAATLAAAGFTSPVPGASVAGYKAGDMVDKFFSTTFKEFDFVKNRRKAIKAFQAARKKEMARRHAAYLARNK